MAKKHDIPIILHSRKAEARTFQLLQEEGVVKADFHCFCGKVSQIICDLMLFLLMDVCMCALNCEYIFKAKLGQQIAEAGMAITPHLCNTSAHPPHSL